MERVAAAARAFGLNATAFSVADGGHINESFFVDCLEGQYFVQCINGFVFADVEALAANISATYAHVGGELLPKPVPSPGGSWLFRDEDSTWRVFERVAGATSTTQVSPDAAHEAGALLGRFHSAVADLDPASLHETIPRFHDPSFRLEALEQAAGKDPMGRAASVQDEMEQLTGARHIAELAGSITDATPVRVSHYDAKIENVLFRDSKAICLVDLDTLMPGRWFFDVGDLLRSSASTRAEDDPTPGMRIDPRLYRAVIDGYTSTLDVALEAAEAEALEVAGAVSAYEQAVRFLTDWLLGDVYFRTARPGQNLDRARSQMSLLASMPGNLFAS